MALHAGAHHADLGAGLIHRDLAVAETTLVIFQHRNRAFGVGQRHSKDQVLGSFGAGALQDDVNIDIALGQQAEHLEGHARNIGHSLDRNHGHVVVLGDAFDEHTFHFRFLLHDGSRNGIDAGENLQLHAVLFGEFDAAVVQDLGPQRGQFQHFVKGDLLQLGSLGDLAGVGGEHAFHVGVDLAAVRVQGGGQCHSRSIAAAAAQGGDVVGTVQPLEACHHHYAVAGQFAFHTLGVQALDAGLGVGAVGDEAGLPAGEADGGNADLLQGHGQQGDGDLLAGSQEHIHLAVGRVTGDLGRLGDEIIGGVALSGHDHHHIIARVAGVGHDARHIEDAVAVLDGSTAKFLYDQCHW